MLSIIIPSYNEEGNVAKCASVVSKLLSENGIDYELVFVIHPLQEYAVMHTFCRGCFFEYGTKMVADALAHGGSCPDRTWAHAAVELAGCVCDELRTGAGGRGAACGAHLLCARVLSGRRILAAAGAGEGAWWSHDVGNVGDRISHSESGCRSADFLRRYRRYAADHAGCRNRWFVHFS